LWLWPTTASGGARWEALGYFPLSIHTSLGYIPGILALGLCWIRHPEVSFSGLRGVLNTRVGYTGGDSPDPTYNSVCRGDGHTEALKVEYDPSVISYERVLDIFWKEHNPTYKSKPQYKSGIWPTTDEQMETALASREKIAQKYGKVATDIEPAKTWYDAEEYHQKYIAKQSGRQWI